MPRPRPHHSRPRPSAGVLEDPRGQSQASRTTRLGQKTTLRLLGGYAFKLGGSRQHFWQRHTGQWFSIEDCQVVIVIVSMLLVHFACVVMQVEPAPLCYCRLNLCLNIILRAVNIVICWHTVCWSAVDTVWQTFWYGHVWFLCEMFFFQSHVVQ